MKYENIEVAKYLVKAFDIRKACLYTSHTLSLEHICNVLSKNVYTALSAL